MEADLSEQEFLDRLNERYNLAGILLLPKIFFINKIKKFTGHDFGSSNPPEQSNVEEEAEEEEEETNSPSSPKRIKFANNEDEGIILYEDNNIAIRASQIDHKRHTRFSTSDHLFNLKIFVKHAGRPPLVFNIAKALKTAIIKILDQLKTQYNRNNHHQVYVTVIERQILRGLNSGNYDINTPSEIIANRVMSMLYNFLKSYQTLRINPSFKIQMKVLSIKHINALLRQKRRNYNHRIYHTQREQ